MESCVVVRATRSLACLGLLLSAVLLAGPDGQAAPQPELEKVRILLVVDTNSDLKESVRIDGNRMRGLFDQLPARRYELTMFSGTQVTADNILNYYRNLRTGPSEGLLFYYAGHGAMDDAKGDYLYMQRGKSPPLLRSTLRQAMADKRTGLTILLTDCCSNRIPLPRREAMPLAPKGLADSAARLPILSPVLRCLLFQHRGMVDITAASKNVAYGDDERGGIFTRSLITMLDRPLSELVKGGDQILTWKAFFPQLEREVETTFDRWSKTMRAAGQQLGPGKQRPRAYSLGETSLPSAGTKPGSVPERPKKETVYTVVSLHNDTEDTLRFGYRWTSDAGWFQATLSPSSKTVVARPLATPDSRQLTLELRIVGNVSTVTVEGKRWSGQGAPIYSAGREFIVTRRGKGLR